MWDCHCHLADPGWTDLPARLKEARRGGVRGWLSCGTNPESWERGDELGRQHAGVVVAHGIHPWYAPGPHELDDWLERLAPRLSGARALGEVGLDFVRAREGGSREWQKEVLRQQLSLLAGRLPVVLHCVRAQTELWKLLDAAGNPRVMVHGFLGSTRDAQGWLERGAYLSLGPHALSRADLLKSLPVDRVLLETDAPSRGSSLLDVLKVRDAWREQHPVPDDQIGHNLARFLGHPVREAPPA